MFCIVLCISPSEGMLGYLFAWSKTIKNLENDEKSTFFIMRTRGSWRKMTSFSFMNLTWASRTHHFRMFLLLVKIHNSIEGWLGAMRQDLEQSALPRGRVCYSWDLKVRPPFEERKVSSRNLQNQNFWRWGFKWSLFKKSWAMALAITMVPTIWKLDHSKSWYFCSDFKCSLTKWQLFVRFSDPIWDLDLLQPNLFLTIQNSD